MSTPQKILVIKLGALGDFIQALGPMKAIRAHHKDAHITLLTTKAFEGFAKDCRYFDDIWLDKRPGKFDMLGWLSLRKTLNSAQFDRVYDLQNNDRTGLYFKLFSPKPEWSGVAKGASHRNTSPDRTAGHAFDGHVQTLSLAGINNIEIDMLDWMKADISDIVAEPPYILLVPGCAPGREEKRWPAQHYAALAKTLSEQGFTPVVLGTQAEADVAKIIESGSDKVLNLIDQTSLAQIVTLAKNAQAAIGNDTGPMHLIGATGCPSIVLFSCHSNPVRHAPKGKAVQVIQEDNLNNLKPETVIETLQMIDKAA